MQRYRFRTPSTGREIIQEAEPGQTYVDRDSGEPLAAAHPISKRFDEIANRIQQLLDYKKIVADKL